MKNRTVRFRVRPGQTFWDGNAWRQPGDIVHAAEDDTFRFMTHCERVDDDAPAAAKAVEPAPQNRAVQGAPKTK